MGNGFKAGLRVAGLVLMALAIAHCGDNDVRVTGGSGVSPAPGTFVGATGDGGTIVIEVGSIRSIEFGCGDDVILQNFPSPRPVSANGEFTLRFRNSGRDFRVEGIFRSNDTVDGTIFDAAGECDEVIFDATRQAGGATPIRTATPVGATATPGGGPTETPGGGPTQTPGPGEPTPTPTSTPGEGATCPTRVTFVGTAGAEGVLDAGWTGQSHDSQVIADGLLTMSVTGCAGTAPNCGVCNYTGPIENAGAGQIDNHRCLEDSRMPCSTNSDCGGNPCVFFFGSYLPLSAGGVSTCVRNTFQGTVTGTFNEDTGTSAGNALLLSTVWTGPTADDPCPKCVGDATVNDGVKGGTCAGGQDPGGACDVMGTHPNAIFGNTSLDCRPQVGGEVAFLDIDLTNTTGSITRTLSDSNPGCTAPGFTGQKCHCDTCSTSEAEACATDGDCPGGSTCGGRRCLGGGNNGTPCGNNSECPGGSCGRPGKATAPNECIDDGDLDLTNNCSSNTGDGDCSAGGGPFEQFCSPSAIHKACTSGADCTVAGDTCVGRYRKCYNNGVIGNSVSATGFADVPANHEADPTLAALFCIGPTTAPAVNGVAGLPGLGRLELPGHATDNGTD